MTNTQTIARALNIGHLPPEAQEKIIDQLTLSALKKITLTLLETLSPQAQKEFLTLSEQKNIDALERLIAREIPDGERMIEEALSQLIQEFRG